MHPFETIRDNLKAFAENAYDIAGNSVQENEQVISAMVADRIYRKGTRSDGKRIKRLDKPYKTYSAKYTQRKKRLNLYQGHVDLNVTGNYLDDFEVEYRDKGIDVYNNHQKNGFQMGAFFREKYGSIEQLTQEQWESVNRNIINPALLGEFQKIW